MAYSENVTAAKVWLVFSGAFLGALAHASPPELPSDAEIRARMRDDRLLIQDVLGPNTLPSPPAVTGVPLPAAVTAPLGRPAPHREPHTLTPSSSTGVTTDEELLVFVSLAMPPHVLKALSDQARRAGAVLVLRGLHDGAWGPTMQRAQEVNPTMADWAIHPELFKVFRVSAVPTIVLASSEASGALKDGCADPKHFTSVVGEMSIDHALGLFATMSSGDLATRASRRLAKLRGN